MSRSCDKSDLAQRYVPSKTRFRDFRRKIPGFVGLCRSRRELSNEYLLAKIGFDTAENEPYHSASSSSREFEVEF